MLARCDPNLQVRGAVLNTIGLQYTVKMYCVDKCFRMRADRDGVILCRADNFAEDWIQELSEGSAYGSNARTV